MLFGSNVVLQTLHVAVGAEAPLLLLLLLLLLLPLLMMMGCGCSVFCCCLEQQSLLTILKLAAGTSRSTTASRTSLRNRGNEGAVMRGYGCTAVSSHWESEGS